jgi:hypothetical protein
MAKITEKRLYRVPPQSFIADGTVLGEISIADSSIFTVGHIVSVKSNTQPFKRFKVKRIPSSNIIILGEENTPIQQHSDLSAYLIADMAYVEAEEQNRPPIPQQEIERHTYEEEPVVARRVTLVDKLGNKFDGANRLPVEATVTIGSIGTPIIYNPVALLANTEYSQVIPDNTGRITVAARNNAKLQIAYSPSTGTQFLTVWPGNIYEVNGIKLVGKTLYFQSTKANTILEIEAWIP